MKHRNFYSNYSPLYPSEMGAMDFGIYRNLANQKDMGSIAQIEKTEKISKVNSHYAMRPNKYKPWN